MAAATAAAQSVIVEDQLQASELDLRSASLGTISFADHQVTPPFGVSEFTDLVDLRPERELIVRVSAAIDRSNGLARWVFESLDPVTLLPTDDVILGFLDPNVVPPEGEGLLTYWVRPKAGLPTGTAITNRASIVFDANDAIVTNAWVSTIDNSAPTSAVFPLADVQLAAEFEVSWSGEDSGAGIHDYSIWVARDAQAFEPWLVRTTAPSALFRGEDGHVYSFFSVARDATGNTELSDGSIHATTLVVAPPPPDAGHPDAGSADAAPLLDAGAAVDSGEQAVADAGVPVAVDGGEPAGDGGVATASSSGAGSGAFSASLAQSSSADTGSSASPSSAMSLAASGSASPSSSASGAPAPPSSAAGSHSASAPEEPPAGMESPRAACRCALEPPRRSAGLSGLAAWILLAGVVGRRRRESSQAPV